MILLMRTRPGPSRLYTGIPGLDDVLRGGLAKGNVYLLEGDPGTGKTTVAMQFALQGKQQGERCLYVSLSESKTELESAARSHNWSLDGISIVEFVPEEASIDPDQQYTVFHPSEVELATNIKRLLAEVERVDPERLVIDSLSEFRLLAQDAVRYRRQLLALKQFFAGRRTTVLLLDDLTSRSDLQVHSIVHGVLRLETLRRTYGAARRRLEVVKIRGAAYREGFHDYTVDQRGVAVYPRLVAAEYEGDFPEDQLSSGLPTLDAMFGTGIERGSSTLILGPTGVGKSSIATLYAFAAATRGERAVLYSFDESVRAAKIRARSLGMPIDREMERQHLSFEQLDPAELSPGEFVSRIKREVEERNTRVIVIDSLNGFMHSMPGEVDLALQLHELLTFLGQKGVATLLVLTQHGLVGEVYADIEISYLADAVLLMRYFEVAATVRHAISIVKKRSGRHENTIRELTFDAKGLHVGEPLVGFKGVLSGLPDSIHFQEVPSEGPENGSKS
jgi:circadian clock protein KaiC